MQLIDSFMTSCWVVLSTWRHYKVYMRCLERHVHFCLYIKLLCRLLMFRNITSFSCSSCYIWELEFYSHVLKTLTWLHHFITMGGLVLSNALANLYWSVCNKPGEWATMYRCVRYIDYISASIIFGLDFKTVQGGIFLSFIWMHTGTDN